MEGDRLKKLLAGLSIAGLLSGAGGGSAMAAEGQSS
jgi:radical SAM modification target selenobiotic family peptide